jgi:hypothetical protein
MSLVHRKKKKVPKSQRPPSKAEMKRATIKTLQQIIDDPTTKPSKRLSALKKLEKLCPEKPKGRPRGKPFVAKPKPEPAPVESPAAVDGGVRPIAPSETPDQIRARLGLKTPEEEDAERAARLLLANKIPAMDDGEQFPLTPGHFRVLLSRRFHAAGEAHEPAPALAPDFNPKFDASGMRIMPPIGGERRK